LSAGPNVWTSIGPDGGEVTALTIDSQNPKTIYAAAAGGIFKSTDGGTNWRALSVPSFGGSVYALAIDPLRTDTVYAATQMGVFKTTNAGASWSTPQKTFPASYLVVDPRSSGTVIAGFAGSNGTFKSTDGGKTWNEFTSWQEPVFALAIDP